jgi:adenylate cyclase
MPDVFISYSRRDSTHALDLAARLREQGLSIWMDQTGISGAEKWSAEIVDAIEESQAIILLISGESNKSQNVAREIALASEQNKHILPVEIETVELQRELKYPLAGLQRLTILNFDAILRALQKLGVAEKSTETTPKVQTHVASKQPDGRKSLLVLPFEDLSPTQDNGWFADGLTGELISALSQVKALRLIDRKTSMECKNFRGHTIQLAKDLDVRYFIEGSVRKFGDQIKISVELLDITSGEHLWSDSHRGKMDDIFEIQEDVARKVVEGLELKLTRDEEQILTRRETENAEAYELMLRAVEYFDRRTRNSFELALDLLSRAIKLDPNYAEAHRLKAYTLAEMHRLYEHNPAILHEAEALAKRALDLNPELYRALNSLTAIYIQQKRFADAEAAAKKALEHAPDDWVSHFGLAYYYSETNRTLKAIRHYEIVLSLKPSERFSHWNLTKDYARLGDYSNRTLAAERALPFFLKRLALHPDDNHTRAQYAYLLSSCDRLSEVPALLDQLKDKEHLDSATLCDLAEVYDRLQDHERAIQSLELAVERGYANRQFVSKFVEHSWVEANPTYSRRVASLLEKMTVRPHALQAL